MKHGLNDIRSRFDNYKDVVLLEALETYYDVLMA